jgi:DNA-binding CsgD family transcriptional regulator
MLRVVIVSILYCWVLSVSAIDIGYSNTSPFIENYTRKTYNAGAQNWCIIQPKGYSVFVANNNGLLVLNGKEWRLFPMPKNQIIRVLYADGKGRIYCGGAGDFGYFEADNQGVYKFTSLFDPKDIENYRWGEVWSIFTMADSIIFQAGQAIFSYHIGAAKAKCILKQRNIRFCNLINNKIVLQVSKLGLMSMSAQNSITMLPKGDFFKDKEIRAIFKMANDVLLIATLQNGLYYYDYHSVTAVDGEVNHFLTENHIYCAATLKNNQFIFGTVQNGLVITDNKFQTNRNVNKFSGLQNGTIISLAVDVYDNLWLGLDNGIDYLRINSAQSIYNTELDIGTPYVSTVFKDKYYLGTNKGLFCKGKTDTDFKFVNGSQGQVWELSVVNNRLYCGHHWGSFEVDEGKMVPIASYLGARAVEPLYAHLGYYIQATYYYILLFKENNGRLQFVKSIENSKGETSNYRQDRSGNLWCVKGDVFMRYSIDIETGTFVNHKDYGSSEFGKDIKLLRVVMFGEIMMFSTSKGLFVYDSDKDIFVWNESLSKLASMHIYPTYLQKDDYGNLWFKDDLNFGYCNLSAEGNIEKVVLLNKMIDDLSGTRQIVFPINKHQAFIHTLRGLVFYDLSQTQNKVVLYRTTIYNVIYNNLEAKQKDGRLYLRFKSNEIGFNFCTNYFDNIESIRYSYKLEGFDEDWSDWVSVQHKEYTNLHEGNYTFQVRSMNADDEQGELSKYSFSVLPPFYRSNYAYAIYVLLCLLSFYATYLATKRHIWKRENRLLNQQQEQIEELLRHHEVEVLQKEKEIIKLQNIKLEDELLYYTKELTNYTRGIINKNDILKSIKLDMKQMVLSRDLEKRNKKLNSIITQINQNINNEKDWIVFESNFNKINENFFKDLKLRWPSLSPTDLKLCAFLKLNKSSKEIASLLNISYRGVETERYRLRQKMNLQRDENLISILSEI